jgi:hypothetical protein
MRAPSGDQMRDRVRPQMPQLRMGLRMRDRVGNLTELCRKIWRSKKLVVYLTIIKKYKHMTKQQAASLIEVLQLSLDYSDHMWDNKESHAKIVGYLQGTLKGTINELKEIAK